MAGLLLPSSDLPLMKKEKGRGRRQARESGAVVAWELGTFLEGVAAGID